MKQWIWVNQAAVLAAHDRLLADYGGADGIRDMGGLESALARPKNLVAYGSPDVADLAAAYAIGIAMAHAFMDANKRTAWATSRMFLRINGYNLSFDKTDAVTMMLRVANGEVEVPTLADWMRKRLGSRA